MADFLPAFEQCIRLEGGYKLHEVKHDRGGMTYAGISRKSWPRWAGWGEIDAGRLPEAEAVREFYFANFWAPHRLDICRDQDVAESIFLGVVNGGQAVIKVLQLTVGTTPDGVIGPKTMLAINAMDPRQLLPLFTLAKIARYRDICMKDRTQVKFLLGWLNRAFSEAA